MTFPGGTHDLWIRYWLAAGGIDPDKDIETITVPPPQMVANMKVGTMDCFCVCEPWNLQLVNQNIGYTAITTGELWNKHPEKSLGMRAAWVDKYPNASKAHADGGDGSAAVVPTSPRTTKSSRASCRKRQWINAPYEDIIDRTKGKFNYGIPGKVVENSPHIMKYWMNHASYPFQSHDLWFITEDIRWGKFERDGRRQGPDQEGQPRGHLARGGEDARREAVRHPGLDLARQGNVLRRQGVRSRKTRPPTSRASRSSARKSADLSGPPSARPDLFHWSNCNEHAAFARPRP